MHKHAGRDNSKASSPKATGGEDGDFQLPSAPPGAPELKKAPQPYTLDDLFLFDPTFESCW